MKTVIAFASLLGCVVGANWAIATFDPVTVWPGYTAPAGVFFAGIAFSARDVLREAGGRRTVALAILLGAFLSFWIEDVERIAIASGIAFAISETADAIAYEFLRARRAVAVGVSNLIGLVLDSVLFLWIAFGSLDFLAGQVIGKTEMTALAIAILWIWRARHAVLPRHASA
jgi:uncharacterized PurR-regulated membrane protein YhhQ (DUF165 family)